MEALWPSLEPGLLVGFKRLFASPLCLQAAFDGETDCAVLVTELFPDMVDEGVRDVVAALVEWQSSNAPAFKRLRVDTVSEGFYKLSSGITGDIHSSFMSLTQSSAYTVLELATKKRQRKYKDEAPDARSKKFEAERRKYSLLLADIIKSAGLPVVGTS
eukprot:s60_g31.t1